MAEEFESYNSVTLTDENGRDIEFELVDAFEHGGRKYCVLFPAEMPAGERGNSEPVILEYIADENGDYLEELADEDEYDEIYGIYLDAGE